MHSAPAHLKAGEHPGVVDALDRVVDAAQNVVADRIDLARLELTEYVERSLGGAGLALLGGVFLFAAWGALLLAAYVVLARWQLGAEQRLLLIAALNALTGVGLGVAGMRRLRPKESHGSA